MESDGIHEAYEALRTIYWEAGIWRKYSFAEFVTKAAELANS